MIKKLKKYGRDIMREKEQEHGNFMIPYFFAFMGAQGGVAAAMAITIMSPVSAPAIACLLAVGCAAGAFAGHKLMAGQGKKIVSMNLSVGHASKIIGQENDVYAIKGTQNRIHSLTEAFQRAAQLPAKVEAKVQAYLQDAAEFASKVRAYDSKGQEKDEIVFTREVFNAQGQSTQIAVGAAKTEMGLMAQQPAPVAMPPTPQAIKALKPIQYTKGP